MLICLYTELLSLVSFSISSLCLASDKLLEDMPDQEENPFAIKLIGFQDFTKHDIFGQQKKEMSLGDE